MIRVLLVDDQALVRSGFRVILETQPDIEVIGEAGDGLEAVQLAGALAPDVICMDVEMPAMNGIEATRRILEEHSGRGSRGVHAPAVLVLTTFGHETYLFDALAAGVSGFLLKTSRAEQLIEAVRTLAEGQALLGPDVTRAVMLRAAGEAGQRGAASGGAAASTASKDDAADPTRPTADEPAGSSAPGSTSPGRRDRPGDDPSLHAAMEAAGLTERERDVLQLVAAGLSNGEIAGQLFLGEATVKTHVSNLLQKLGARDRVQLVVWALTAAGR